MKLNPIFRKELITRPRSGKFAAIIFVFNLVLSIIGVYSLQTIYKETNVFVGLEYREMIVVYIIIAFVELGIILFMVPAYTSGAISGERERQTLDILLSTRLKPKDIIMGKLASSICTLIIVIFSSMPIIAVVFAIGGFDLINLLELMLLYFVTTVFVGSIGIFFSALLQKTTASTTFTYGAIVFIVIGTSFLVYFTHNYFGVNAAGNNASHTTLLPAVLLINPIFTLLASLSSQFGTVEMMKYYMVSFGEVPHFILANWFLFSIIIQIVISLLLVYFASSLLDPLRGKREKIVKKEKQRINVEDS